MLPVSIGAQYSNSLSANNDLSPIEMYVKTQPGGQLCVGWAKVNLPDLKYHHGKLETTQCDLEQ